MPSRELLKVPRHGTLAQHLLRYANANGPHRADLANQIPAHRSKEEDLFHEVEDTTAYGGQDIVATRSPSSRSEQE